MVTNKSGTPKGDQLADGTYSSEYKVGDKFVVVGDSHKGYTGYAKFSIDAIVELCHGKGEQGSPQFKLLEGECGFNNGPDGCKGAYSPWKNVKSYKPQFTKSDLKDGMVVEYRNGWQRVVLGDKLLDVNKMTVGKYLSDYDDSLLNTTYVGAATDIIKVSYMGELLWQREEAPTPTQLKQQRITKELEFAEAKRERLNAHIEILKRNLEDQNLSN